MAYMTTHRCLGCSETFSSWGPSHRSIYYCVPCERARAMRRLFGEGEVADRWLALLYPETLEQEQRVAAAHRRLADAFELAIEARGVAAHEFTDS